MISNPFALFDLEPGPLVDLAALKERFTRATAESHPDKFAHAPEDERSAADSRYASLNKAYQTLIDPRARLLALYELTKGEKPRDVQRIPPGTMDLFKVVGETCRELDTFLARKAATTGRLERAGLMTEELALQDSLEAVKTELGKFSESVDSEIAALDARWRSGDKDINALETVYRKSSYIARWQQQLEEREIALLTGE